VLIGYKVELILIPRLVDGGRHGTNPCEGGTSSLSGEFTSAVELGECEALKIVSQRGSDRFPQGLWPEIGGRPDYR
jgi:hypothetical protein